MQLGEVVAGRFTVESPAGSGGMGEVWRATDAETGAPVAIKVLRAAATSDRVRFEHEVRALAEIRHPAIVRYVAHGFTAAGEPYLVMEWLTGEDLGARLARERCSVAEALEIARQAAEGLAALHERGMVHRDIKPSNLFLVDGRVDRVKLIDFGLVRTARPRMTLTGALVGTPGYAAPEQAQGAVRPSPAADVFSLGCVLFEALTGRHAFQGDNVLAVLAKLILAETPELGDACPDAPPELAALLQRMLAKHPEDRPRDAGALRVALAELQVAASTRRPAMTEAKPRSLTGSERRVLSVILIPALAGEFVIAHDSSTLVQGAAPPALAARMKAAAESVGGVFTCLADGSMVVTIAGMEAAKDRAAVAARFALSLRELVRGRPLVLATGAGEGGVGGVADTSERAARRLARAPHTAADPPIAIDEVTAALLDARFDCHLTPDGPELLGERVVADMTRTLLGRPSPCVGRERNLQTLAGAFREAVEDARAQAVLVVAPPGVGKSRLAHEFVRGLAGLADVWSAHGEPFRVGSSLALLGDAVRSAVGVRGGEPLPERQARLRAAVDADVDPAERRRVLEFLGELVGAPFPDDDSPQLRAARLDAAHMADQLQRAFDAFLAARCRRQPVVLVLEDLHWADHLSVRLLDAALRNAADRPLLVLALARPEVFERFPALWAERHVQQIRLGPLSRRAAEQLVRETLGPDVPEDTCATIVERADGHAFYLEELIRATAEGRRRLPETVVAMAQSRVEALDPPLRRILRAASVFGHVCWAGGVQALIGADAPATRDLLAHLVDREFLTRRRESRFPGEDELEFRHALLREGAYAMLTAEDRRLGHRLAVEWLEQRGETDARVLAEHCDRSDQAARAVSYYQVAADDAWDSGDAETAAACAARGLGLGADGPTRGALLSVHAAALARHGDFAGAVPACLEALGVLRPDSRHWMRTFQTLMPAVSLTRPDRLAGLIELFHAADADPRLRVEKVHVSTWVSAMLAVSGMIDPARELLAGMRRLHAADPGDEFMRNFVRATESVHCDVVDGRPWEHMRCDGEVTRWFAAAGMRNYQCICGAIYGKALMEVGDLAGAEAVQREILAVAVASGDPISLAYARLYLARTLATVGSDAQLDEALAFAGQALAANVEASGQGYTVRAECLRRRGRLADAEREARLGNEVLRPLPAYWWRAVAVHARILLALGRTAEAVAVTEDAVARLFALQMAGSGDIELLHVAAAARRAADDDARAASLLAEALHRLRERLPEFPPEARPRFLRDVPTNAALLADAHAWLGEGALSGLAAR